MSGEELKNTATANWGLLRTGVQGGDGLEVPTIPLDVSTRAGRVRLSIGPKGEPRVLLPLTDRETTATLRVGSAVVASVLSLLHRGQRLRFLDLICLSPDLETVFGDVVDEMISRISRGDDCLDAARSTIEDFRSLLIRAGATTVDRGRVAGLIAELLVLNRLLDRSSSAWRAWRGPAGDRHDFRVADTSLEVKASLRPRTSSVTINGLEQLEPPVGGTLHLLHVVLEPVTGGELSVARLGQVATTKVEEPEQLNELLGAIGCIDINSDAWNRHTFHRESESLYEVQTGFPRLTTSMLCDGVTPHGVHDISYQVDLSAAVPFLCCPSMLDDLEQRLCR